MDMMFNVCGNSPKYSPYLSLLPGRVLNGSSHNDMTAIAPVAPIQQAFRPLPRRGARRAGWVPRACLTHPYLLRQAQHRPPRRGCRYLTPSATVVIFLPGSTSLHSTHPLTFILKLPKRRPSQEPSSSIFSVLQRQRPPSPIERIARKAGQKLS